MGRTRSCLDDAAVAALFERAEDEVSQGRVPACQLAVCCGDELRLATFGAPDDARFLIFSLTKSLIAGAVWVLFGDGALRPSTRVVEAIPEFGTNGKDAVTVEHLLTHTGGFPRAPMRPEEGATSAGRIERFATWELEYEPGTKTGYHPTSAHWVLAELLERVSGTDYRAFVRERVTGPLGLESLAVGVPDREQHDVVDVAVVGNPDAGTPAGVDGSAFAAETASQWLLRYNEASVRAIGVPGAGGVGSAGDLARYFSALLHNPAGVWDADVLRDATTNVRNMLIEPTTGIPANRTLGLMIAGDDGKAWMREVGTTAGPRTFVASAAGGQVAWADPDTGLSFCFLTSGIDADVVVSVLRSSELSTLAGACSA